MRQINNGCEPPAYLLIAVAHGPHNGGDRPIFHPVPMQTLKGPGAGAHETGNIEKDSPGVVQHSEMLLLTTLHLFQRWILQQPVARLWRATPRSEERRVGKGW